MNGFLDIHSLILVSPLVACVLFIFLLTSKTNYLPRLPNVSFFTTIRIIKHFFAVIHWVIIFVFLVIGFLWTDLFFLCSHLYPYYFSYFIYSCLWWFFIPPMEKVYSRWQKETPTISVLDPSSQLDPHLVEPTGMSYAKPTPLQRSTCMRDSTLVMLYELWVSLSPLNSPT